MAYISTLVWYCDACKEQAATHAVLSDNGYCVGKFCLDCAISKVTQINERRDAEVQP